MRPVWVDLDKLFWGAASDQAVFDGLDITGRTRGLLYRWLRSSRGDWMAEVNFQIFYSDGRPEPTVWYRQLVPGYALSPRDNNLPLG